jgi:hypothetical protein
MRLSTFLVLSLGILSFQAHANDPAFGAHDPAIQLNIPVPELFNYGIHFVQDGEPFFIFNSEIDPKPIAFKIDIKKGTFQIWGSHQVSGQIEFLPSGERGAPNIVVLRMRANSPYQEFRFESYKHRFRHGLPRENAIALGSEMGVYTDLTYNRENVVAKFAVGSLAELKFKALNLSACQTIDAFAP